MFRRRPRTQKDFDDEIRSHIALETDRLIAEGMPSNQARLEAIRRFGSLAVTRERFYESRRLLWWDHFQRDLRYALTQLRKSPAFAVVAILTLAIGIGATTMIFSIVDGVLLRPLPYQNPERLVAIWNKGVRGDDFDKRFDSYSDFEEYRKHSDIFDQVAAATWAGSIDRIMTGRGAARDVGVIPVSDSFFQLLGVAPLLGRVFDPSDLNNGCSVVLSHGFWKESFDSRTDVVGQSVLLDEQTCQILGVMPSGFTFYPEGDSSLWTLITPSLKLQVLQVGVGIFARLKPHVTTQQAQLELRTIHAVLHQTDGKELDVQPIVRDLQGEFTWLTSRNLRATVWVLFAAVNLVLLISCLNLGSLLLGRSLSREREMAVRAALGSGRWHLIRQLLTEALFLSLVGGAAGVALASFGIQYFHSTNPIELPVGAVVSLHSSELLFALAVSIATAVIFGLAPAWKVSGVDLNISLKTTTHSATTDISSHGLASILVALQTALAVVLMVSAGLLMSSVLNLGATASGFNADHVLTADVTLHATSYSDEAKRLQFYDGIQQKLGALNGASEIALTSGLPPFGDAWGNKLEVEGRTTGDNPTDVSSQSITPNYFHLMGEPLRAGRGFDSRDRPASNPVAIVNEALIQRYLPDRNPIGMRVRIGDHDPWLTIVGVIADEKYSSLREMVWVERPVVFRPLSQDPRRNMMIAIRTTGERADIGKEIQQALASIDTSVPATEIETLQSRLSRYVLAYPRFRMSILSGFAAFALLLTAIGIYGVMATSVQRRRHEIGIRMALGARLEDVRYMVILHGVRLAWIGLIVGIAGSLAVIRLIRDFLYGVAALNPVIFIFVPVVVTAVTLLAVWLPARNAIRIDPIVTLRSE